MGRGPESFAGRKLGLLVSDGADADLVSAITAAVEAAGARMEVIAPRIAGATLSDGELLTADQKIDGGPSVLYDAVAIVLSQKGAAMLAKDAAAKDFVTDAFAHCKLIAYSKAAMKLLDEAGIGNDLDAGCKELESSDDAATFLEACSQLRLWDRELEIDLDA